MKSYPGPAIITPLLLIVCLLHLTPSPSLGAALLDPALEAKLETVSGEAVLEVELQIAGGIVASELDAYLDTTCSTLDCRRREGVLLLQNIHAQAQSKTLSELRAMEQRGEIESIVSHWLTNSITVMVTAAKTSLLAELDDVAEVFQYPEAISIEPIRESTHSAGVSSRVGVEESLKFVGADSAWRMGYDGKGRIVCHFDGSGIDGKHPALISNWKGNDGNPGAAYNGLFTEDGYPRAYKDVLTHGTHVTGTMVGHDDLAGDTVGVAPGANWIGCHSLFCWEWAANPDGDPYTTDDVPDAINISWAYSVECGDRFDEIVDMTEALGIVNIFAAGNSGSDWYSARYPACRAFDSLTNFAVGSVNAATGYVWWSSGRGPSVCDSISIKPNLTAPGVSIRSTIPGGGYEVLGGTSMAAPHVTGAVAILRQAAPNATSREIKHALLAGATAMGDPHPNNYYGWGILNIPGSLEYLSGRHEPDLRVVNMPYVATAIDDTVTIYFELNNRGKEVDSVLVCFERSQPGLIVLSDSIPFGHMATGNHIVAGSPFRAVVTDSIWSGASMKVAYTITCSGGYEEVGEFVFRIGLPGDRTPIDHRHKYLQYSATNFGRFDNFRTGDTTRDYLYEAALLVGADFDRVSDGFRNADRLPDDDFWVDAADSFVFRSPGARASRESSCIFTDGRAEQRLGVQVTQTTYTWDSFEDSRYVLLEYIFENISSLEIPNLLVGLAADWTYRSPNYDISCEGNYSSAEQMGYLFKHTSETDSALFRGVAVLNDEGAHSYRVLAQYIDGYVHNPGLSDSMKFAILSEGLIDTSLLSGSHESLMHVISTGPFSLAPGEQDTAYFALLGADSLHQLRAAAQRASARAQTVSRPLPIPGHFSLRQNYPNPFNAVTHISFELFESAHAKLEVFNILGQKVTTLLNRDLPKGEHSVVWRGTNHGGHTVASGIYFYRLSTPDRVSARKMILIK